MIGVDLTLKALGILIIKFEIFVFIMISILFLREIISFLFSCKIKDDKESALYSCLLSALTVAIFHFMTSEVRDFTLSFDLETMQLRKLFYLSMFTMECAFVITLVLVHKIKDCQFSLVAHFCFMTSTFMCLIQLVQLYFRGFLGLEFFVPYYKLTVVSINLLVLVVISLYPLCSFYRIFKLSKEKI
ncbi:hypothetical protein CJF42_23115 [Pseudoalteromonas sp. NBT06-2]|uniref:hypothetical protein n=1 Tax=Pseudoalteromonas sp. NBT06-2 TaxID=2025950 RepID=UPI000BA7A219|nr:hypothetical protein [Pseudoalteromonas sp. NBT06-2]PAJ72095.1 hypothetical protein CJF42_23115 [Pseudoalteromonas sp. NBT06-2]